MGKIVDCVSIAEKIKAEVKAEVEGLKGSPHLAVIIVDGDAASKIYVRNKHKVCEETGVRSSIISIPNETTQKELEEIITKLNNDKDTHGILLQLPLPKHLSEQDAISLIKPEKDVDGLHPLNAGLLSIGSDKAIVPCTPSGVMRVFKELEYDLTGKNVTIIGRSNLFGKPMAQLVLQANATPTLCHSRTKDLREETRKADVVIAAIGQPKMIDRSYLLGCDVVIDVGINRTENGLCGDVDLDSVISKCSHITPVPRGIGVLTTASLMKNVLKCYALQGGE